MCYIFMEVRLIEIEHMVSRYKNSINLFNTIISFSAIFSVLLLYRQIKIEHEKARREKTIELLMTWSINLTPETNFAVKIVEKFDKEQCSKLFNMEEFFVSNDAWIEICEVFSENNKEDQKRNQKQNKIRNKKQQIKLKKYYIKKLRYLIIQYLNLIETVLLAWQNSIVDREIIEQQFAFLYKPQNNKNCLQDFRTAAGSEEAYPSIEHFV